MEPSRKSRAIELILFLWHYARWCHQKCGYTQLQAATNNHYFACLIYSLLCLAALVPKFMTLKSGMKAQVSLEKIIELHDLVYYLGLEPAHHWQKAKVLLLDHHCLLFTISKDFNSLKKSYSHHWLKSNYLLFCFNLIYFLLTIKNV